MQLISKLSVRANAEHRRGTFMLLIVGAVLVVVSTTQAAKPSLPFAIDPESDHWFQPENSRELIYIGPLPDQGKTDLVLILKRTAVANQIVSLWIQSDADMVQLRCVETELMLPSPGTMFDHQLVLSGLNNRPQILLDQTPMPAVRGRWIRMLHHEEGDIEMVFVKAGYANVRVADPTASARPTGSAMPAMRTAPTAVAQPRVNPALLAASETDILQGVMQPPPPADVPVAVQTQTASDNTPVAPSSKQPDGRPDVTVVRRVGQADEQGRIENHGYVSENSNSGQYGPEPTPGDHQDALFGPKNEVHLNVDVGTLFPTAYFYRGFGRENQELIVQPYLGLDLSLFRGIPERDGLLGNILTDISIHTDLIGTFANGPFGFDSTGEAWSEVIFKAGASMTFFERATFMVEYENIESIRTQFRDVHQANFGFYFDDADTEYPFSLQPYVFISWELENESDGGWLSEANENNPLFQSGLYLELGIDPQIELFELWMNESVTVSVPMKLGFSIFDYYQDPSGVDDFFGYGSIGAIFHVPLFRLHATGGRSVVCTFDAGVELLFLGASARRLSQAVGTGDGTVVPIGKFAINFWY